MKINKIILPVLALGFVSTSCEDQVMEWREGDSTITAADIPLATAEKLKLYKPIKEYVAEYHPNLNLSVGIGADMYLSDTTYKKVVDTNFTGVTLGNAMKMGVLMSSSGKLDFTTVDKMLAAMPSGMKLYGHNLLWHTQQQQTYLKSLIAPELKVESTTGVANMLPGDASNFNGGTTGGWGAWGSNYDSMTVSATGGSDGSSCVALKNKGDGSSWQAQFAYTLDTPIKTETTYVIRFKAKSTSSAGQLQFQYQNSSNTGSQGGYYTFNIGTSWNDFEHEFTISSGDFDRILLNFGAVGATYYIDDIEFGTKVEGPTNYVTNGNFSDGLTGWALNNGGSGVSVVTGTGPSGNKHMLKLTAPESAKNAWDLEVATTLPTLPGKKVTLSFYVRSETAGKMRCAFSGLKNNYPWLPWLDPSGSWSEGFETSTSWTHVSVNVLNYNSNDFAEGATEWTIKFDLGYNPGVTYYIDDVKVVELEETSAATKSSVRKAATRGSSMYYILKTAEEKRAILLDAMEKWISGVMTHVGDRVDAWDVINEPINDGDNGWRGIDGVFNGEDTEPVETTETGLTLNWASNTGNQHWYWGYYIGKDYGVKAFEYARKYAPNAKLFINDYNLETSPNKLAALIDFVKYIDEHGTVKVDGIGTQMHVNVNITKAQVDAMFKTLAATGKLIRITELDVAFGVEEGSTITPSAAQLQTQSDVYQMIITSYFENIPAAQQSAITIWTLSDNKKEHEYWLTGDAPNIFDSTYARKTAYKGVCDAIAGKDLSEEMKGEQWKDLH